MTVYARVAIYLASAAGILVGLIFVAPSRLGSWQIGVVLMVLLTGYTGWMISELVHRRRGVERRQICAHCGYLQVGRRADELCSECGRYPFSPTTADVRIQKVLIFMSCILMTSGWVMAAIAAKGAFNHVGTNLDHGRDHEILFAIGGAAGVLGIIVQLLQVAIVGRQVCTPFWWTIVIANCGVAIAWGLYGL